MVVNPGSLLGTRMVQEDFGIQGNDVRIGVRILVRAALSADLAPASGAYFDNDAGRLADPLPDALSPSKCAALLSTLADLVER